MLQKIIKRYSGIFHKSFEVGILLKAIDGFLEIICGFLLFYFNPVRLDNIIVLLTQHELSEDPNDFIANHLINFSAGFSISSQHFGVIYLLTHGAVKLLLVYLMWKEKSWSYPLAVFFMILFIFYQIYRYTIDHSVSMIVFTALDIVLIFLTLTEYRRVKPAL